MTQDQWDSTMAVHLGGHFSCGKAAARIMMQQKSGSITNIASRAAFPSYDPQGSAYSAAKAGVIGFTAALAQELKQYGIRVNCIFPVANTNLFPGTAPRGGGDIPAATHLDPENIAPMLVYLATDEAKNITGQFIYATGFDFGILNQSFQMRLFLRNKGRWTVDELAEVIPSLGLG